MLSWFRRLFSRTATKREIDEVWTAIQAMELDITTFKGEMFEFIDDRLTPLKTRVEKKLKKEENLNNQPSQPRKKSIISPTEAREYGFIKQAQNNHRYG